MAGIRRLELTGKKFGYLKVQGYAGKDTYGNAIWMCKCKCGKRLEVSGRALIAGIKTHCGCVKIPRKHKEIIESKRMHMTDSEFKTQSERFITASLMKLNESCELLRDQIALENYDNIDYYSPLGQVLNSLEMLLDDFQEIAGSK